MEQDTLRFESASFYTPMVHLYRGEMNRMTVWRQRLDVTSNWAILLTLGLTTFTLGSREIPHYTLLLGLALIGMSLFMEARRYQHLHHSKWRLYLLEAGFFAEVLRPGSGCSVPECRETLARDLRSPRTTIHWMTAVRLRLRRNYLMLFYFITAVWIAKLFVHPSSPGNAQAFYERLTVGDFIPSWFVALTATAFVVVATALALTCPPGDRLESWSQQYTAAP